MDLKPPSIRHLEAMPSDAGPVGLFAGARKRANIGANWGQKVAQRTLDKTGMNATVLQGTSSHPPSEAATYANVEKDDESDAAAYANVEKDHDEEWDDAPSTAGRNYGAPCAAVTSTERQSASSGASESIPVPGVSVDAIPVSLTATVPPAGGNYAIAGGQGDDDDLSALLGD